MLSSCTEYTATLLPHCAEDAAITGGSIRRRKASPVGCEMSVFKDQELLAALALVAYLTWPL
jgi:hypothetical protein